MAGRSSVLQGALLAVGIRWIDRLLGFLSTIVLARLLVPSDFGIVAMASLVIGLIDVLMELGVNAALIQNRQATEEHYHSAWTLRLIQTSLAAAIVLAVIPLAVDYFDEPRVADVLPFMALGFLLTGLENIWTVDFQKHFLFKADFQLAFGKRFTGFAVTIVCALVLQSYWALIAGTLAGRAVSVLLSYLLHPKRPKLSLSRGREIFAFSKWVIFSGIGRYLDGATQSFIVGGRTDAATMGLYSLSRQISGMPSTEILMPLNRVLFPVFARAKHDRHELKRVYLLAQRVQCLMAMPAGVGLALVAAEAVALMLGPRWAAAVPFVQVMAFNSVLLAVTTSSGYLFLTLGRVRDASFIAWFRLAVFLAMTALAFPQADALQIAEIRLFVVSLGFCVVIWLTTRVMPNIGVVDILRTVARPVTAAAGMALVLLVAEPWLPASSLLALAIKILLGAIVYVALVFVMWALSGRPDGGESYLLGIVSRALPARQERP